MRIGSLCSGVGGLELGLERAGVGHTVWQVEIDPFCRQVLAKHWPDALRFEDVKNFDPPPADVICAGFPCQPHSNIGNRLGVADERWLWPFVENVIGAVRPVGVVLENVPGLLSVDGGWAFASILGGLARVGYDAEWGLLSARQVGAPHVRKRLFIIAWQTVGNTDRQGPPLRQDLSEDRREELAAVVRTGGRSAEPGLGGDVAGLPPGLDGHQWPAGRGADQFAWEPPRTTRTGRPDRGRRIKALGNAVVPQVAEIAGRRLLELLRSGDLTAP